VDFVIFDPLILTLQPAAKARYFYRRWSTAISPSGSSPTTFLPSPILVRFAGRRRGRWRTPGGAAPAAASPGSAGGVEFKEEAKPVPRTALPHGVHLLGVLPDHDGRVGVEFAKDLMQDRTSRVDDAGSQALPCNDPTWRRHPLRRDVWRPSSCIASPRGSGSSSTWYNNSYAPPVSGGTSLRPCGRNAGPTC
jgi:hypothetical protein